MLDEPPLPSPPPPTISSPDVIEVAPHGSIEEREDGSVIIDLLSLGRQPNECATEEPDPFNPEILVCREVTLSPRIGPNPLPEVDDFGNAIPRARVQLSEGAEAQANAINKGVGGFNANGGEVRVKIDF